MNKSVNLWILKANNDLKVAHNEITIPEPVTDIICFHCQQCVEKYLKAFLISNNKPINKPISKTHDLNKLIEDCLNIDKDFEYLLSINVDKLTICAVEIRYPDEFYTPTIEEAQEAIELAERVKEFVLSKLSMLDN